MRRSTTLLTLTLLYACQPPNSPAPKPKPSCDDPAGQTDPQTASHFLQLKAATAPDYLSVARDWIRLARTRAEPAYYQQARACAEQALQLTPDDPAALQLVGLTLLNDHRFAEARELALKLIARHPDDALSWGTLSDAELELGDVDGAITAAQEMMDRKPNLPSYGRAAHLQWLQGNSKGAKLTYQQAIAAGREHKDREPSAWMITQAAWVFWHEGDYVGAAAGFQLALAEVANYAPALEGLGRAALARGDQADAIAALQKALSSHPLVETAWALGDAHSLAGEHAAAEAAYAQAVELGTRHDPRTLALFYATRSREPREALRLARIAYQERQDCYSKDALAFALYRNGRTDEALPLARAAIALGTPDARLLYHAGLIESSAGDAARGNGLMKRALELNPRFDTLLTGGPDGSLASKL